jgi:hypothetical protein
MRFKVAPSGELSQRGVDILDPRRLARPIGLGQHFVGSQLQTVLTFRCREDIQDAAVKFGFLDTYMPEQLG